MPQVGRLHKAKCPACGYIIRTARKWLDTAGAPLCPCNGEPMLDCREGMDELVAEPLAVKPLGDRYVMIRRPRYCSDCGRFHDIGAVMQHSVASVRGQIQRGHFCVDCTQDIEHDPIPCRPPGTRISELMGVGG